MRKLLCILIFLIPLLGKGQYIFQNLQGEDGLSAKQVRCLHKDPDGFLWIGTVNGLNRYDGAVVKKYVNNLARKELVVNDIYADTTESDLMVATTIGIYIFNKDTGKFSVDKRFAPVKNQSVLSIRKDGLGKIWVITTNEIYVLHGGELMRGLRYIPELKMIEDQRFIVSAFIWDEADGGFWIGGTKTYFLDCRNRAVYDQYKNPKKLPLLELTKVYAITLDKQGNVWYGSNATKTLYFWNRKTNKVEQYNDFDGIKLTDGCNFLFVDSKERLWISTWLFAAFIKEPGKPIKKIPYSQEETYSIGYGHFNSALEDENGDVWLGTINGVSKNLNNSLFVAIHKLPSFKFIHHTGFAHINHIQVDGQHVMACKEDGIVYYDLSARTYKRFFVTQNEDLIRNRFVMSVKVKDGTWWFAGHDGIYHLTSPDKDIKKFTGYTPRGTATYASFVFQDQTGKIWFQIDDDAIYRYNPDSQRVDRFDGKDESLGKFRYQYAQSYLQLRNGDILFAMEGEGFVRFDIRTEKFTKITVTNPNSFYVNKPIEDPKGNIWATVFGRGLIKFSPKGTLLDSINTGNGLISDQINNIDIDANGNIWTVDGEGLQMVNPVLKTANKIKLDMGKTLQDYWNFVVFHKGLLYAVMLDHLVILAPSRFGDIRVSDPPVLSGISSFGRELGNYRNQQEIELEPDNAFLTFQYASRRHRDIPSLQYSYQLENIDKDWIYAGRSLSISYSNLLPGRYTFKVRSTDGKGRWMRSFTKLGIVILPHWWQTWWFYLLIAIQTTIFSSIIYNAYLRRVRKAKIDKTISYFMNSAYGENSVSEICWDIARNCMGQLNFEDCVVYLLDRNSDKLVQKAAYGSKNLTGHEIHNPIEISVGEGIVGTVAQTGKPLIIADTSKDPRYIMDDEQRFSELAVPIMYEGKVLGVIDSEHSKKDFFRERHLNTMVTIAAISATKIAEALALQMARENQIQVLQLNKMLAESQLIALRAQMNPHFVFNCLNSILECIVTGKISEGADYLNKFAKLFRLILNNSGENLIAIEEEISVLRLYLELELMRFGNGFTFKIECDDQLLDNEILVPSMLFQPYVENALWHGLMHKSDNRHLTISFTILDDSRMQCAIEDNGIGRKKSMELKKSANSIKKHVSKGLMISQQRLELIRRQGEHAEVKIIDKYDDAGEALGTLVQIELSTSLDD
ncbi:sensor histidine kinase [Dyadobacter luticola]|uniref:GAF domain-containing protein n=1 Tax=Dyadobacter luticola TaxID=1979387 RepID=A0A5R9L6B6_9BACT|nr:histidine kinase [Dyadobacter luticola]TLV03887.1 GAF domain-containing protein [Dyadobacter luticola]